MSAASYLEALGFALVCASLLLGASFAIAGLASWLARAVLKRRESAAPAASQSDGLSACSAPVAADTASEAS